MPRNTSTPTVLRATATANGVKLNRDEREWMDSREFKSLDRMMRHNSNRNFS